MKIPELLSPMLVIALGVAFLVHFAILLVVGELVITEPNPFILATEILLVAAFVAWAAIDIVRKWRKLP